MVGEHSHGIMRHLHNVHIMWVLGNKNIHVGTCTYMYIVLCILSVLWETNGRTDVHM